MAAISDQVRQNIEDVSKHINDQTSNELEREIYRLKKQATHTERTYRIKDANQFKQELLSFQSKLGKSKV